MNASSSPAATMSPRFFPSGTCSRRTSGGSVTSTSFTLAPSPPSNHLMSLGAVGRGQHSVRRAEARDIGQRRQLGELGLQPRVEVHVDEAGGPGAVATET